jgi:hypothetical protein
MIYCFFLMNFRASPNLGPIICAGSLLTSLARRLGVAVFNRYRYILGLLP